MGGIDGMKCTECPFRTPVCYVFGDFCYVEVMEHSSNYTLSMSSHIGSDRMKGDGDPGGEK